MSDSNHPISPAAESSSSSDLLVSIQEAWEAAGGNPGIRATKSELLSALRMMSEAEDEVEAAQAALPIESDVLQASYAVLRETLVDCDRFGLKLSEASEALLESVEPTIRALLVEHDVRRGKLPTTQLSRDIGMTLAQEPKYTTNGYAIINRASGKGIPADEPVFVFRARDVHAREALESYACVLTPGEHRDAVCQRISDFAEFSFAHPERMKQPDTAVDVDAPLLAVQVTETSRSRSVDALHGDIMNIRTRSQESDFMSRGEFEAYKFGHRDARHDAAELVLERLGGRHLTLTSRPDGELVAVTWQDDEHRILEVVWMRQSAAPVEASMNNPRASAERLNASTSAVSAAWTQTGGWAVAARLEQVARAVWRAEDGQRALGNV
jgi:hypothetical protein